VHSLLELLFGCMHRRTTFPQAPRRWPLPTGEAHVTCLECGREIRYDWNEMRAVDNSEVPMRLRTDAAIAVFFLFAGVAGVCFALRPHAFTVVVCGLLVATLVVAAGVALARLFLRQDERIKREALYKHNYLSMRSGRQPRRDC
jgi:hypothetical protein